MVNICWLFGFLAGSKVKNMVQKSVQIETWGLFLILGIGVWYYGERQFKHIPFDPPWRENYRIAHLIKIEKKVLLKIAKIDFLKDFPYKIHIFRKNHTIFTWMTMKASTRCFNVKIWFIGTLHVPMTILNMCWLNADQMLTSVITWQLWKNETYDKFQLSNFDQKISKNK